MDDITYDVRIYRTDVRRGTTVVSYHVRWKVGGRAWKEAFRTDAQADSFRSSLLAAARNGKAFNIVSGRPVAWERNENETDMSWYEFACAYVDMKWKNASAKYRKDIARALTAATPALLTVGRGKPDDGSIRIALFRWGFNAKQRASVPAEVAHVLAWVAGNSLPVSALADASVARRMLDAATTRVDGKNAAPSTARRHRTILANAADYANELKLLTTNPIRSLKWKPPKISSAIDKRCVINPCQAGALLEAVRLYHPSGARLVAFFAILYYAGLRPEEAVTIRKDDVTLPSLTWNDVTRQWDEPPEDDDWGELHFRIATPDVGGDWTDDGSNREVRQLKHRAAGDSRTVPTAPPLTRILRAHIRDFGTGPDGRLFVGIRGGEMPTITYRRAWITARQIALTSAEQASPLARRPYDLRHACLSTWLNGGVPPTQVAEWAGHSVDVLLRIYAKCLVGQDELARRRIVAALRQS